MSTQPEALRLAEELTIVHNGHADEGPSTFSEAAAELLAQHELIQKLKAALEECVEDSQAGIDNHIQTYGLTYRAQRLTAMRKQVADARAALAAAEAHK